MVNQTSPQSKHDKKAILSLVLGSISIGLLLILYVVVFAIGVLGLMGIAGIGGFLIMLLLAAPLLAIIGLILGIMGMKSTKKKFAIGGIVLCGICILFTVYLIFKI